MPIVKTIDTASEFRNEFYATGRKDQFSYEALRALFDYYNELTFENTEMDVVAICCDWTEIDSKDLEEYTGCASI